jgi:hypothetical protein
LLELLSPVGSLLHLAPHLHDPHEDDQVQDPNQPQEGPRDGGADHPPDGLERLQVALNRLSGEGDRQRQSEDDGGVAEGEEESHPERALPLLEEEASGVIDRRDVVGVEYVPQPEAVGERPRACVDTAEVVRVHEEERPPRTWSSPTTPNRPPSLATSLRLNRQCDRASVVLAAVWTWVAIGRI